ncbi:MAG: hypothetical protein E7454_06215 [Ruminococcaceae bacterium]|nr:hypothetical protein [Oscillospiraceae bacterium]
MKRLLCLTIVFCCIFTLFGCTGKQDIPNGSIAVYYKRATPTYGTADSVIAATYLEADGKETDYPYLIDKYLNHTPEEDFLSIFPKGVQLESFHLEGLTAKIVLSDHFADLTGMNLTVACTCLTKTLMEMTGCREVIISAKSMQLDGHNFITLNQDSFLLLDDSTQNDL